MSQPDRLHAALADRYRIEREIRKGTDPKRSLLFTQVADAMTIRPVARSTAITDQVASLLGLGEDGARRFCQ
ncbi:MAG: hypothetical protein WEE89_13030 [Gemmatimonadota bacterium]